MKPPRPMSWMNGDTRLVAMLHLPIAAPRAAIVMLPGGSDYRIGSHRSYVRLAMVLAEAGYAVMRLDVAGMGDSGGTHFGFEALGSDIASAMLQLRQRLAPETKVFLWGQCDGASAIILGLGRFQADGAILCNPWVRSAHTSADQLIRHHYRHRLTSRQSWRRLLTGQTNILSSLKAFVGALITVASPAPAMPHYLDTIATSLRAGRSPYLVVIGSADVGGQEFRVFLECHQIVSPTMDLVLIDGGNHSFSTQVQRQALQKTTIHWLESKI
jgi:uncharacterized protein